MSIANLHFSRIFIHVSQPFYICKHNLRAAMDKEDCGLIAAISTSGANLKLWVSPTNLQFLYRHIIIDWRKQY
jgi:hypothetical protein